jgi:hypothetical protein
LAQGKGTTGAEDGLFSYHVPAGDYEERGPGFQHEGVWQESRFWSAP